METLTKKPARRLRGGLSPYFTLQDPFFVNDPSDFQDGNGFVETIPPLNIKEEKNNYIVEMAVPGLKKEDFNIQVEGNLLTISCEKETEKNENGKKSFSCKEFSYSCFSRSVRLPDYVDTSKIVAKYTEGILNLTIPGKPEVQKTSKEIKVQ